MIQRLLPLYLTTSQKETFQRLNLEIGEKILNMEIEENKNSMYSI